MNTRVLNVLLVSIVTACSLGELAVYYPQLPANPATHFDLQGNPDGWATKQQFAVFYVGALAAMTVILIPLPWLTARSPKRFFNLPRRDYWFAPERESETRAAFANRVRWICFATWLLFVAVLHGAVQANLQPQPKLVSIIPLMVTYFVFLAAWLVEFYWHFAWVPRGRENGADQSSTTNG